MNTPEVQTSVHRPKILCVDDEQKVLSALKRTLHRSGYHIHTVSSGQAALTFLEQNPIDILISDMRMPEMEGAELLQRTSMRWPNIIRILLTGYSDLSSTIAAINNGHIFAYINKPWDEVELQKTLHQAWTFKKVFDQKETLQALTQSQNHELKSLNKDLDKKVNERTAQLSQTVQALETANLSLKHQHMSSICLMANLLEQRTSSNRGHTRFVSEFSLSMAEIIGVNELDQETLYHASLIQDIGLIGVPDQIIETSYARLQGTDKKRYEDHCLQGEKLLSQTETLRDLANIIHQHHEYYDGSGYPEGISGSAISPLAHIITVCSDYYQLIHGGLLKNKLSASEAQEYLVLNAGKKYAPDIVKAALEVLLKQQAQQQDKTKSNARATNRLDIKSGTLDMDVYTPEGTLLLSKGSVIDQQLALKLQRRTLETL